MRLLKYTKSLIKENWVVKVKRIWKWKCFNFIIAHKKDLVVTLDNKGCIILHL